MPWTEPRVSTASATNRRRSTRPTTRRNPRLLQLQPGYNLSHAWQIQYTARFQNVDVLPGTLARIATIGSRFSNVLGEGTNRNFLNRVSIVFDTRDDIIIPD